MLCEPQALFHDVDRTVEIVNAIRLPTDQLAVFLTVKGSDVDLDYFQIAPFGSPEDNQVRVFSCLYLRPRTARRVENPVHFDNTPNPNRSDLYRLSWSL